MRFTSPANIKTIQFKSLQFVLKLKNSICCNPSKKTNAYHYEFSWKFWKFTSHYAIALLGCINGNKNITLENCTHQRTINLTNNAHCPDKLITGGHA
jgi:hypothetical protein